LRQAQWCIANEFKLGTVVHDAITVVVDPVTDLNATGKRQWTGVVAVVATRPVRIRGVARAWAVEAIAVLIEGKLAEVTLSSVRIARVFRTSVFVVAYNGRLDLALPVLAGSGLAEVRCLAVLVEQALCRRLSGDLFILYRQPRAPATGDEECASGAQRCCAA
jgi:hypothetical protein